MRAVSALLAVLLLTLLSPAGSLKLSPPQVVDYRPGKLLRVTATGADKVAWEVVALPAYDVDFVPGSTAVAIATPPAGTTVYVFAAAVEGGAPVLVKTSIVIRAANGNGNDPNPARPPERPASVVRHLTVVGEQLFPTQKLKADMAARGVSVHEINLAVADPETKRVWTTFYRSAGGPCFVLQDSSGNVIPDGQVFRLDPGKSISEQAGTVVDGVK